MGILDQYEAYYLKYRTIYGEQIAVLFQVGTFHQLYGVDNETEQTCNLTELANLLNIKETRVNTSILENSRSNPQLAGFNSVSLDSNVDRLVSYGYTVIVINQTGVVNKDGEMTREVAYIQSPATIIDMNAARDPFLVSVYIKQEFNRKMSRSYDYIGMAALDITTGQSFFYETSASPCDPDLAMDNLKRFLQTFSPVEAVINAEDDVKGGGGDPSPETIESWGFRLCNERTVQGQGLKPTAYYNKDPLENITSVGFQEKILTDLLNIPDPLVSLNISCQPMATKALIYLLKFCADHNTALLTAINKPQPWGTGSHLVLDTRSIIQLGILESYYDQLRTDSVVNHLSKWTVTSVGRRTLRHRLLNCITCPVELQSRYDEISRMGSLKTVKPDTISITSKSTEIELPLYDVIFQGLKGIKDLDRMHRKLALGTLSPAEFYTLDTNYQQLVKLFTSDPHPTELDLLQAFRKEYISILNLEECGKCTVTEHIRNSIFVPGHVPQIDQIALEISRCDKIRQEAIKAMSDLVAKGSGCCKYKDGGLTAVTGTGCWVTFTKPQYTKFDVAFPKAGLKISNGAESVIITRDSLSVDTRNKSNIKIEVTLLDELLKKQDDAIVKLRALSISEYNNLLFKLKEQILTLDQVANCVGIMDVNQAMARVSEKYGYCKPVIGTSVDKTSFLNVVHLRHPLVERRCTYIPHDLEIKGSGGMLLYGVNQSGKSCTMKSVGIAVVMAQAGFYVPAKSFEFYPYKNLMTRIIGNDNIDNGLSSYAVEMMELRSILTRACSNTLVLGDEVCHGTESASAVSLVAASLIHLDKVKSSFIFATHLHELSQMEEVANIRQFHITVQFAPDGRIVYDRQFKPGSGTGLYGIEVARHLRLPGDVVHDAVKLRNKYFPNSAVPVAPVISKYNTACYISKCGIKDCQSKDKNIHEHHIRYQSEASDGLIDGYLDVNNKDNLIGLCEEHHNEVHHGNSKGEQLIIFSKDKYEYRRMLKSLERKLDIPGDLRSPLTP
jgi:DNA mismatch repair protein MutS